MTQEKLNKALERHLHWIRKDCAGWENMRANLEGAILKDAFLESAHLEGAILEGANLEGANLEGAILKDAFLMRANLEGAILKDAFLEGANLRCANLEGANLEGAILKDAFLMRANLEGAILKDAILEGANLEDAILEVANLKGAKQLPFIPIACPDTGSFIGWKKAHGKIIKLEIPADAKRCSATSNKCRCDKAKVLEIQTLDGSPTHITKIPSDFDEKFIYEAGKTVSVKDFCEDRWRECSQGIHFFINRQSAVEY